MKKTLTCMLIAGLALSACGHLREDCQQQKKTVDYVAATATTQLQVGMSRKDVRRVLGEPHEILLYDHRESWKYSVLEDCKLHQGISGPTTELTFVDDRLLMWLTYGR
jgi:hypothetical protein